MRCNKVLITVWALVLCPLALNVVQGEPTTRPRDAAAAGREAAMAYEVLQDRDDRLIVKLANRMIVIAQEVHAAPVASAQVWVKTGSIYEQEFVGAGLSHFLEHLLSGGSTSTHVEAESSAILGAIGAQTNAATSLNTVRYYIDAHKDHVPAMIDLLSDWMQNSLITDAEYQRERQVIQREFESGQGDPGRILWKLTQQIRYRVHPARHPTIGYLDEFLLVGRDQIYDFYKRMYVPNNMLFVVAGDIDRHAVVQQIAELWSAVPAGKLPQLDLPIELDDEGPRQLSGSATVQHPRLRLMWPGVRLASEDDYALDLLAIVLGQGESSRLVRQVRDEQRAAYSVSSSNWSVRWGQGSFFVDAGVAALPPDEAAKLEPDQLVSASIARTEKLIYEQIDKLTRQGITAAELARAKRKVMASVIRSGQDVNSLAERLASDTITMGDPDYLTHYARAIQDVNAEQVVAVAGKFLRKERMIRVTLLPLAKGQGPPTLTRPADLRPDDLKLEDVELDNTALLDRFRARPSGKQQAAAPVKIGPIQLHQLPNGLRLLIQRNTLVPTVAMQLYSLGGLLSDEAGHEGVAGAVAAMTRKGTAQRSAQQIAEQLDDLGAVLGSSGGNNTSYIQAECLKEDWAVVLELLADVTLRPTFPEEQWAQLQPRLVAAIGRQNDRWSGELGSAFRKEYFGTQHPWSQSSLGRADVIAQLSADDLRQFHRSHLGASQTVLAVFGDVDPDQVLRRVKALFDDMPAKAQVGFDPTQPKTPAAGIRQVETSKPMAAVQIGLGPRDAPGATRTSPDYPALLVLSKVFSHHPGGWLHAQLRGGEGDGLAYAVWSYQFSGIVPGCFIIVYNTGVEQVPKSLRRTMATVQRARQQLVDAQSLARAKAAVITGKFLGKQSNSDRAADAALNELYGLPLDEPERFVTTVNSLDADKLQAVARRYLQNPVTVVLTNKLLDQSILDQAAAAATSQPATQ
jgi:zinc protease